MKNILVALAILLANVNFAQDEAASLLYRIEVPGKPDSYLFGTIHMIPQSLFEIEPKVRKALDASDVLVLEMDISDPGMAMRMVSLMNMKDGLRLRDLLNQTDYDTLSSYFQAKTGMSLGLVETYKPFFISSMLMPVYTGEDPASFELALSNLAYGDSIPIWGLESLEEQMGIFDAYPYEAQAEDLMELIYDGEEMGDLFDQMTDDYLREDVSALYASMDDYFESPEEREIFLFERNRKWVEKIIPWLGNSTYFIAVGAGHLGGEEGLINLLRREGYTLIPIMD